MKRKYLSLAVAGVLLAPVQVLAQDATGPAVEITTATEDADATTLDRVTVTARRRVESIQDVPVAVTAFGEESLRDLQASSIEGLQGAVPNLNIVQGRGSANSINVFIRGIGQPDALHSFDPGVGIYVDDVYYSRINGAMFSLFDVSQVEVLRGPQGTLYGKNSTGGAIKVTTKNPFDDQGASVELLVGDEGRNEMRLYGGGSLNDNVAGSIAFAKIANDGYVTNPVTGEKYNDDDTLAFRGKLALRPADNVTATFSVDWSHQEAGLTMGHPTAPLIATDLVFGAVPLAPAPTGEYDFTAVSSFTNGEGQDMTHKGGSLAIDWDISNAWLLKSITAWRKLDTNSYIDIDATALELGDVFVGVDQSQLSQEVQLQYDNGSNLQAVFGAYYQQEDIASYQEAYADDFIWFLGAPVDFLRTISDDLDTTSTAVFAHASWEFAPTWTLAGGVRWSEDDKHYDRTTSAFFGAPLEAASEDPQAVIDGAHETWSAVTPSVSLQKAFSDNVMGYVSANRGFKSGGFNGRANSPFEAANAVFDPEFVWTYEVGAKMQSDDGRLRGNIAAFRSNYEDFQARVSEVTNPDAPIPSFGFPVLNAAKLVIDGIEFEGQALLGESTTVAAQLGWMDARYDEFVDPRIQLDPTLAGLHDNVPFSPEFTGRIAVQHGFDLGDAGLLSIGADASYRSDTWLSVDNRPGLMQDDYTLFGAFATWDSPDYKWQVRAGVRNLTDELYKTEGQEFTSVANIQTVYYGLPRNYYLSVRYNFF